MNAKKKIMNLINSNNYVILDFTISNYYEESYFIKLSLYVKNQKVYSERIFDIDDKDTLISLLSKIIEHCDSHIKERIEYWG